MSCSVASRRRRVRDAGQALPLVVGLLALSAAIAFVLAQTVVVLEERAQARTAADAAALAGAAEGRAAAEELARTNGAELVSYEARGAEVTVEVAVGRARARARAERGPIFEGSAPIP